VQIGTDRFPYERDNSLFRNLAIDRYQARRLAGRIGSALLAISVAGCSTGDHRVPSKTPTPTSLRLPHASGTVLPVIGYAFKVQGVEAGRGISLPEYFSPPEGTTNVYVLLELKGTFTSGARTTPGPLDGVFDFHAPECADQDKKTNCSNANIPMIGGLVFLTREEATKNPAAFFKRPQGHPSPPQLISGIPYYTLVAEAIPTTVPLKHVTFCSDKQCLSLAGLPTGSL
jgi:hypothetical protein